MVDGVLMYDYHPKCDPDVPANEAFRTQKVAQCLTGVHVWRFYGTVDNPAAATTLSKIDLANKACRQQNVNWRVYPANPADASDALLNPRNESVWNIRNYASGTPGGANGNKSFFGDDLFGADTCFRQDNRDVNLARDTQRPGKDVCHLTTGPPFVAVGMGCQRLMTEADPTVEGLREWLASTDPNKRSTAQRIVATNFEQLLAGNRSRPQVAAQLAGLAGASVRSASQYVSVAAAAAITPATLDYLACSSTVDFVKMPILKEGTDPKQRVMSICVAPVMENGFATAGDNLRPVRYLYGPNRPGLRPHYGPNALYLDALANGLNGSMLNLKKIVPSIKSPAYERMRLELLPAIRETLEEWDGGYAGLDREGTFYRPGGEFFPTTAGATTWQEIAAPESATSVDAAMETLTPKRGKNSSLTCYTSEVREFTTGNPGPSPDIPVPVPTTTPAPKPDPWAADPARPNVPGPGDGTPNVPGPPTAFGTLRMVVSATMDNALAVRGFDDPAPGRPYRLRATSQRLVCDASGRRCDAGLPGRRTQNPQPGDRLDPQLVPGSVSADWDVQVKLTNGQRVDPSEYTVCDRAGGTDRCAAVVAGLRSPLRIGEGMDFWFFSPTGKSTLFEPFLTGGTAKVNYYRWAVVDQEQTDCTGGSPAGSRLVVGPPPRLVPVPAVPCTPVMTPVWAPVYDHTSSIGIEIEGPSLARKVYGSIGGSAG
jgi:hypothetical protein